MYKLAQAFPYSPWYHPHLQLVRSCYHGLRYERQRGRQYICLDTVRRIGYFDINCSRHLTYLYSCLPGRRCAVFHGNGVTVAN